MGLPRGIWVANNLGGIDSTWRERERGAWHDQVKPSASQENSTSTVDWRHVLAMAIGSFQYYSSFHPLEQRFLLICWQVIIHPIRWVQRGTMNLLATPIEYTITPIDPPSYFSTPCSSFIYSIIVVVIYKKKLGKTKSQPDTKSLFLL